ncbi:MAG: hypothetical protein CFE31_16705 [Rhizobiales bacterium PAR1]|nr:MAG: hypothetical protein CFE31_16705 [Rhizobiales bacterium PAR1]
MTRHHPRPTGLARWSPMRLIRSRPRLVIALVAMPLIYVAIPASHAASTRLLVAWDAGMAFYLIAMVNLMFRVPVAEVPSHVARQDVGQKALLILAIIAALASFLTIAVEIRAIRHVEGFDQALRVGLILITLLLSWCFVQSMFALHYAHLYFMRHGGNGLVFPGVETHPDFGDFLYFSATIGAAFATSDVSITQSGLRRLVLAHTVLSFLFNTLILGLSVNVGASLL